MKGFIVTDNAVIEIHIDLRGSMTPQRFGEIIRALRRNLADTYARGSPVAAASPANDAAIGFYDIIFHVDDENFVRVRFMRHNLYLIAYRVNDAGDWHEMPGDGGILILAGSAPLPFGHNYADMLAEMHGDDKRKEAERKKAAAKGSGGHCRGDGRGAGRSTAGAQSSSGVNPQQVAGGGLTAVYVGLPALVNGAQALVSATSTRSERARALLVIAVMFSEAARFEPILNFLCLRDNFHESLQIEIWMVRLINLWSNLSSRVLRYEAHPNERWVPPPPMEIFARDGREVWRVHTVNLHFVDDIARILGILLRADIDDED